MAATTSARQADQALASLLPRPPTPPKETSSRVTASIQPAIRQSLAQQQTLQTPPSTHTLISPATTESNSSSNRLRKRVEWSAHTEYKDAPQYLEGARLAKSSPVNPGTTARPIKGILKATSSPCQPSASINSKLGSLSEQISISDMLDSTIKQLSGADRDSKVDAYMALARALKTSNNLPDRVALQGKLSLLTQFIQRDITLRNSNGSLDRSLVNHALVLLTTFLHFNAIASTIPFDFAIFITDHAIRSFEDPNMPKEVIRYLMQVMAFQSFAPKVMSHDRVGRLVAATHRLEGHISGKSIVMSRIQLYKRLVKQSPHHMVTHADWLQDLFTDMLSLTKDIRNEAINLGIEAGFQLRHDKQILRHVLEILQTETEEKSFIQYYIERLQEMLKDRERSAAVPQVWTVVNLFMRCPLERWELYGPWLTVVQSAFNTADSLTKLEANYAWNRYVYLCFSEGKLSSKSLVTLCQPLLSQLRKKANPKNSEEVIKLRRTAIGGACNLYYYAFRPGNEKFSPDMIWDVAVQPVLSQLLGLSDGSDVPGDWVLQAAKLLNGLVDSATPRVWREDRIKDTALIRPDELPPLDPKWIRRNSETIFKAVGVILERKVLDLANQDSVAYRLWQSLVGAVAAASAKDIKVSDDTVKFFACAFGLLYKIWFQSSPSSPADSSRLLKGVSHMVRIMISGLGILPFTEKRLSMTTPSLFEAIVTPSARGERQEKNRGVVRSPCLHLLNLFCTVPEGVADDEEYSSFILSTFDPFFAGKSEKARIDQARDLLRGLPRNVKCPSGIWIMASQSFILPFTKSARLDDKGDKILGPEYREMITFLERGLTGHPNLPLDRWISIFKAVHDHVGHHFGPAGQVLVMIEPIAKSLIDLMEGEQPQLTEINFICIVSNLLAVAEFPRDKQAMEAARRHLWGAAPAASQHGPFKPFENLYKAADSAMKHGYRSLNTMADNLPVMELLQSMRAFIAASGDHGEAVLSALVDGLNFWIADANNNISSDTDSQIAQAVRGLWSQICRILIIIGKPRQGRLGPTESLLSSGCKSTHRPITMMSAETWNGMVDKVEDPQCSDSLKSILSSLNSRLDMEMTDAGHPSNESGAQPPASPAHQDFDGMVKSDLQASTELNRCSSIPPKVRLSTRRQSKTREEATPRRTRSRASKKTGTPRFRHDDSQIEFTAVASSSLSPEDSQHLTERQKEVHERQKAQPPTWPGSRPEHVSTEADVAISAITPPGIVSKMAQQQGETTPDAQSSYEDLISSTPTPRRGQVLQMDDLNDPPSSPPELRPYPLLSEIQTRSRTHNSLEGWEFSSPLNSPSLHDPGSAFRSCQGTEARSQFVPKSRASENQSNAVPCASNTIAPELELKLSQPQSTVQPCANETGTSGNLEIPGQMEGSQAQGRTRKARRKGAKNKSLEKTILPQGKPSKRNLRSQSQDEPHHVPIAQEGDTSCGLDEGARSKMLGVIVAPEPREAEAVQPSIHASTRKRTRSSLPIPDSASQGPEPATRRRRSDTRKRKNDEIKQDEPDRKKRAKSSRQETESKQAAEDSVADMSSSSRASVRTRRSSRIKEEQGQPGHRYEDNKAACDQPEDSSEVARTGDDAGDAGDTDEELLSQLMADSRAASQSQSQSRQSPRASANMKLCEDNQGHPGEVTPSETTENSAAAIIALLSSGKNMLRGAAISRAQVDELEMIIMDLKREMYQAEFRGREQ